MSEALRKFSDSQRPTGLKGPRRLSWPTFRSRRGAILILVLWLLVVLSLIGLSYSFSVRTGIRIEGNRAAKTQARYYAKAGIERTIVELLDRLEPSYSELSGFYDDEEHFVAQPIGTGFFSLTTGRRNESGLIVSGITDEAARVNINVITEDELLMFPEITQEMAASLIDWRDEDYDMGLDGAEDDYYSALPDPYYCKNADFQTVAELLLVRGWTQVDLFGEDVNENGRLDPNEDDGDQSAPIDDADGELDMGLAPFFTVYSSDYELDPDGQERLELRSASEQDLRQIQGMTDQQARSIVAWRNNNKFDSLADLFDVTVAQQNQNSSGSQRASRFRPTSRRQSGRRATLRGSSARIRSYGSNQNRGGSNQRSNQSRGGSNQQGSRGGQQSNQKAFTFEQIAQVIDYLCIDKEPKHNRININTAPYEVLMTLPGMTDDLANAIITHRESGLGPFTSRGDLREVDGMTEEIFKQLIDYVTVQSYQFRIIAEGREGETKAVIETVVDLSDNEAKFLYWHEL